MKSTKNQPQETLAAETERLDAELRTLETKGNAIAEQCLSLDKERDRLAESHSRHLLNGDKALMDSVVDQIAKNRNLRKDLEAELATFQSQAETISARLMEIIELASTAQQKLEARIEELTAQRDAIETTGLGASFARQFAGRIAEIKTTAPKPYKAEDPKPFVIGGPQPDTQPVREVTGYQPPKVVEHTAYGGPDGQPAAPFGGRVERHIVIDEKTALAESEL